MRRSASAAAPDPGAAALPPTVPNLATALRALGYETAAFVGNPTLDKSLGFANGFDTYVLPESLVAGLEMAHPACHRSVRRHRPCASWDAPGPPAPVEAFTPLGTPAGTSRDFIGFLAAQ